MSRISDFGEQPTPGNSLTKRKAETPMVGRLYAADENDEREMTLRDHWQILRNHAWVIIPTVVAVTLMATVLLALSPDFYEGHARVEINLEGATPPPGETENHFSAVDMDPAYFATQLQIIRSPMVLEQVVKALDLQHDAIYKRHMAVGGRKLRQLLRLAFLARKDQLIEEELEGPLLATALNPSVSPEELKKSKELEPFVRDLQKRLTVEPVKEPSSAVKDTRLVSIIVRHPSPALAAKLANAISDAVVYSNRARKLQAGKTTNAYLMARIDGLQSKIRDDERSLANYASNHNILSLDPSQNTAIERLSALNRQLVEAENTRKEAEANYDEASRSTAADTRGENHAKQVSGAQATVIDPSAKAQAAAENVGRKAGEGDAVRAASEEGNGDQGPALTAGSALAEQNAKQIADLDSRLAELRQKRAQLLVGATEKWPEVEEVDGQIASVENSLARMRGHATSVIITNLGTKYRQELAHEAAIRRALELQRRVTQVQNQDAVEYRLLQQQIETEKNLLNGYLKRFDSNDVAQAAIASNIRVVDYATLSGRTEAAGPWRLVYVALAFIVSLSLSSCLSLFLEYWDDTIRSSDEVKQVMRLPALAAIPAAQIGKAHRLLQATSLQGNGRPVSPALLLNPRVSAVLVENYRRLRTAVRSMMPENCKVLVVTSALSGEGKTTTAVNLGISLSQMDTPVLLIDGDTHQQRLSEVFRMGPFAGLQELLATPKALDEKEVFGAMHKHEATGVYVLPAGRRVPSSAELLGSAQMKTLLGLLSSRFAYVLIDTPAITACVDTIILSKSADRVLMVVESAKSSREIVRHAQAALVDSGAKLLGVALNKVKLAPHAYNYEYYGAPEAKPRAKAVGAGSS
jgi:polysaccharide biosynthesis transport protein